MSFKDKIKKNWKKIIFRLSLIIAIFVVVVIAFISPITKYVIEKYDVKFLGREISLDWAYVNPFTGYVYFDDLKIFEEKSDSIFFSVDGLSVNFTLYKLLAKTYEISSLTINKPKATLIKFKESLNIDDILLNFSDEDTVEKAPVHFNILDIKLNNGEFYIKEKDTPVNFSFLKIDFESDGKYWDKDFVNGKLSMLSGVGSGLIKAKFLINSANMDYKLDALVKDFNLNITKQYLKALADYGSIEGKLNADVNVKGNFKNQQNIDGKGNVEINDFHFGKDSLIDFVAFKQLAVDFKQIAPARKKFIIDSVILKKPVFKFEKYDYLDNIQHMFGEDGSKVKEVKSDPEKFNLIVSIADYMKVLFKNFFESDYKLGAFDVEEANLMFNDYSLNEKFSIALNPFNIRADSIDSKKEEVNIFIESGIKPYGNMAFTISLDPRTNKDFNINYALREVPLTVFNPYLITFTSFPMNRGKLEVFGNWKVRNNYIQSENNMIFLDPRLADRIRKHNTHWLPARLLMFFVRERGNVIDYEIPIVGDINSPKFKIKDVIFDVLTNIFIKPPTTPYRYSVRNVEVEIEKSLSIEWEMRQVKLNRDQEKFLDKISDFLHENPEAQIEVHPRTYNNKEKEHILFFEAKKKYYLSTKEEDKNIMSEKDSLAIEKLSIKDSVFIIYLNKQVQGDLLFTVQEKCYQLVGADLVNQEFIRLTATREKALLDYFAEDETNTQIKMKSNLNEIPFKGFSYFKISFDGEFPDYLKEANQKLNMYDNSAPRQKYKKLRNR